jgi:nucleoid-associated protein YgaU
MSVATEFAPIFDIPERARTVYPERALAPVVHLYQPSPRSVAVPLRLTRRGVIVLSALVAVVGAALLGLAWASAPASAGNTAAPIAPSRVTVQSGDTLWSIAARVAPQTDPRAEVAHLLQLNHIGGTAAIVPGQLIRTR